MVINVDCEETKKDHCRGCNITYLTMQIMSFMLMIASQKDMSDVLQDEVIV